MEADLRGSVINRLVVCVSGCLMLRAGGAASFSLSLGARTALVCCAALWSYFYRC